MIQFLKRLFGICEHEFVFHRNIEEQNLRGGYEHASQIFVCRKCGKHETREVIDILLD